MGCYLISSGVIVQGSRYLPAPLHKMGPELLRILVMQLNPTPNIAEGVVVRRINRVLYYFVPPHVHAQVKRSLTCACQDAATVGTRSASSTHDSTRLS